MLQNLLNQILIPGNTSFSYREHNEEFDYNPGPIALCDKASAKLFFGRSGFNREKPTIMYFHVNGGADCYQISSFLKEEYNVIAFEFLGYGGNRTKKQPTVKDLVLQSHSVLKEAEKILKEEKCYGNKYERSKNLIFVGRSLGTMIATKLAANLEKDGKGCKAVINLASPVNMNFAVGSVLKRTYVRRIFICCFLASSTYFFVSFYKFYDQKKSENQISKFLKNNLIASSIIFGLLVLVAAFSFILLLEAKSIGIKKDDLNNLQKTPVKFVAAHGDAFCRMHNLQSFTKSNKNIEIIKTDEPEEDRIDFFSALSTHNYTPDQDREAVKILESVCQNNGQGI